MPKAPPPEGDADVGAAKTVALFANGPYALVCGLLSAVPLPPLDIVPGPRVDPRRRTNALGRLS